eukprot:384881_1
MVTLFYCIVAYLSMVNSQPLNYIVSFNDLMVGDYVIITGKGGGYLTDPDGITKLKSSSTFGDTAIWEVTDDFPTIDGIEFKNTETGNYIKGDGAYCVVGSSGSSWIQETSGTFQHKLDSATFKYYCCVDSADEKFINYVKYAYPPASAACTQFVFHIIRSIKRTRITSFDNLAVNDHVIIES